MKTGNLISLGYVLVCYALTVVQAELDSFMDHHYHYECVDREGREPNVHDTACESFIRCTNYSARLAYCPVGHQFSYEDLNCKPDGKVWCNGQRQQYKLFLKDMDDRRRKRKTLDADTTEETSKDRKPFNENSPSDESAYSEGHGEADRGFLLLALLLSQLLNFRGVPLIGGLLGNGAIVGNGGLIGVGGGGAVGGIGGPGVGGGPGGGGAVQPGQGNGGPGGGGAVQPGQGNGGRGDGGPILPGQGNGGPGGGGAVQPGQGNGGPGGGGAVQPGQGNGGPGGGGAVQPGQGNGGPGAGGPVQPGLGNGVGLGFGGPLHPLGGDGGLGDQLGAGNGQVARLTLDNSERENGVVIQANSEIPWASDFDVFLAQ